MDARFDATKVGDRFASLLDDQICLRPIYDNVLMELHGCVITPTLGSIIPRWLLIIPKVPTLNFRQHTEHQDVSTTEIVAALLACYELAPERAIWFEHGPSVSGSMVGCGVDHAHLHVIIDPPFSHAELCGKAQSASSVNWNFLPSKDAYAGIGFSSSYFIVAANDRACVAVDVDQEGSQFFRKVIADLVSLPEHWNYRLHPHLENVAETVRAFSALG